MTLNTPIAVDGGVLNAGSLTNQSAIELRNGSVAIAGTTSNNSGARFLYRAISRWAAHQFQRRIGRTARRDRQDPGPGAVANNGLVSGDGNIATTFSNNAGGEIRGESGKTLLFTGTTTNVGRIDLQGGTIQFTQQFSNAAAGQINGQGTLYFPTSPVPSSGNPNAGLMNAGSLNFTGGNSQIYGTVEMQAGSRLIVTGGATASFFDAFRHDGLDVAPAPARDRLFWPGHRCRHVFWRRHKIF